MKNLIYLLIVFTTILYSCKNQEPTNLELSSKVENAPHNHKFHKFEIIKEKLQVTGNNDTTIEINNKYILHKSMISIRDKNIVFSDTTIPINTLMEFFITKKIINGVEYDNINNLDNFYRHFSDATVLRINAHGNRSCYKGAYKFKSIVLFDDKNKEYKSLQMPSTYHFPTGATRDTMEYYLREDEDYSFIDTLNKYCPALEIGIDNEFAQATYYLNKDKINPITAFKQIKFTCIN